mmetsp:Transcript_16119/g.33729  ORF Transcript_16119/g.33729 Transcript_16119/m.33729 type:complete len:127 (-) Transcript_16119:279-659(-)
MTKLGKAAADESSYAPSHSSSWPVSDACGKGSTQMHYEKHSRVLKILIAICRGLHNDRGDTIFSEAEQPWKGMKVAIYCPMTVEYKHEILCRANQLELSEEDNVSPQPAQGSLPKVLVHCSIKFVM